MSAVANMTPMPLIEVSKSICFLYSSCAKEAIFLHYPDLLFKGNDIFSVVFRHLGSK